VADVVADALRAADTDDWRAARGLEIARARLTMHDMASAVLRAVAAHQRCAPAPVARPARLGAPSRARAA
jgi:hypothetical protein